MKTDNLIMLFALGVLLLLSQNNFHASNKSLSIKPKLNLQKIIFLKSSLKEISPQARFLKITLDRELKRDNVTINPNKTCQAFTVQKPISGKTGLWDSILIEDLKTGFIYEVVNLRDPHRPFSDVVWTNNNGLQFDRWASPHHGVRYLVDFKRKKIIRATAFVEK